MPAQVTILAGPARSGKTASLVARYQRVLAENAKRIVARALWIAPTRHVADEIRGCLLNEQFRGCFTPGVYTFERFAQGLLARDDWNTSPRSPKPAAWSI